MKNIKYLFSLIVLGVLVACNQTQTKDAKTSTNQSKNIIKKALRLSVLEKCYVSASKKDTAFLSICEENGEISGQLWYKFYEKDNAKGTIKGFYDNDTLKLNFSFDSEGSKSEMPIKMVYKNAKLYEVYGKEPSKEGSGFVYSKTDNCGF